MANQFRLPDVGEGLTEAEILRWFVKPGDVITVNQVICEIETAKAAVELPSPFAGVVQELLVSEGQTVEVGTPIITVGEEGDATPAPSAEPGELQTFKLPDVGEGLTEAEILQWFVKPGDVIAVNQVICEIETAKAAVELPSPFAGTVAQLLVEAGTTVAVGAPIITVAPQGSDPSYYGEKVTQEGKRNPVLVGYGVKEGAPTRRRRVNAPAATAVVPLHDGPILHAPVLGAERPSSRHIVKGPVRAKPLVRKLARELGVDLSRVFPTGPHGTISRADVEAARSAPVAAGSASGVAAPVFVSYDAAREERIPVKGVLKQMAQAMVTSAYTAPHVTEWVDVEVSAMLAAIERLKSDPAYSGTRPSPLLIAVAAVKAAIAEFPRVNVTWDEAAQEVVVRHYANIGIAAATPRGLLVPVIHEADAKTLPEIAQSLTELINVAREGKTAPEAMMHGTMTITNVGVFGVDGGTPIIPPGQGAILALGQVRERPWVIDGQVVARPVCELTLSFDHRMIDGELGSKVLARIASLLNDPTPLL
jgi:pyruvate dehydrogenase E2 component (dihydrolipoamide acetyltransferase)